MDESHLPYEQQSLVFRLRKRAEIRRQISSRKSVQEGRPDRLSDLLEEAADELESLRKQVTALKVVLDVERNMKQSTIEPTLATEEVRDTRLMRVGA